MYEYRFPELGEGLHEGEIIKWHIKPGDEIQEDQIIMEVQNDKAVVEVPSPVMGKVTDVKVKEGTVAHVGDVVAVFEVAGAVPQQTAHGMEQADIGRIAGDPAAAVTGEGAGNVGGKEGHPIEPNPANNPAVVQVPSATARVSQPVIGTTRMTEQERRELLATPGVRKLARENGIDLRIVPATGKGGRITRGDVEGFVPGAAALGAVDTKLLVEAQSTQAPAVMTSDETALTSPAVVSGELPEERTPLKGVRKLIAQAMEKSVYTAPHVTVMDEVDVSQLVSFRERVKPMAEKRGVKLTYLPFIVKAAVAALKQYPTLNASIDDEKSEIVYKKYYHIGIATDTDNGLMVPVIAHADRKSMWTIAADIKDMAVRAREGKLAPHELKGSSFTITNIGSAGGMFFTPVINWPEVAILGTGRISEKPVVRDGVVEAGKVMALSLSFDHRLIDGATAQMALNYMKQLLADPELLVMEV